ncbi:hypothetical protein ACFDTO_08300 [Microbacteriaceae bacterium 4G12]
MSGRAGWRSVIPWWYVGGAVVTLVVPVLLAGIVDFPAAAAAVWAPYIGIEIIQRRATAGRRDSDSADPQASRFASRWREPLGAALMTLAILGAGLIVGFRQSEPPNWTAATVGIVMVSVPLIVIAVALVRRRGTPPA